MKKLSRFIDHSLSWDRIIIPEPYGYIAFRTYYAVLSICSDESPAGMPGVMFSKRSAVNCMYHAPGFPFRTLSNWISHAGKPMPGNSPFTWFLRICEYEAEKDCAAGYFVSELV